MKKILLSLFIISIVASQGFSQDIVRKQRSLITKFTATWCPHCGTWGWDLFKNIVSDNEPNAICWAVHFDGSLNNPTATSISNNFSFGGQPIFFLNETNQGAASCCIETTRHDVQAAVMDNAALTPVAAVGVDATMDENGIGIDARVKFYQAAEGEYYLAMYVIEDNLLFEQSPIGSNAIHTNVLRASFGSDQFGTLLTNGFVEENAEFFQSFNTGLNPNWETNNLQVAAIIWKKEDSKYTFVNGANITEFSAPVSANEIPEKVAKMELLPNISADQISIQVDSQNEAEAELGVYDLNGKLVKSIYTGRLAQGTYSFELHKSEGFGSGVYFVHLKINDKVSTRKLVFK